MQTASLPSITSHLDLIKTSKQSWLEPGERFLLVSLRDEAIRKLQEVSKSLPETARSRQSRLLSESLNR